MEPLKSKPTSVKACIDTVSSKCVVWDGPEITCIDGTKLCKGQSIDSAIYTMATKLCEVLDAVNIKNYNNCIETDNPPARNIRELFDFVIANICKIQTEVNDLIDAGCPTPTAEVPNCLVSYSPNNATTLPVDQYAVMVAGVICTMLASITTTNAEIADINSQIDDLWAALSNCNQSNQPVQPTCTYDYSVYPDGRPVTVQEAYTWLEAAYCSLYNVIGTTTDITNAISKQCPDLSDSPRLYGGGPMSNIPGWNSSPVSVSDSIGNMWLTVCDMRGALDIALNTCCFSICNYLEFGYNAIWDVNGTYVDVTFIGFTTLTEANAISTHTNAWSGTPGGPAPAWVLTDFPNANMTNVILTLNDGTNQVTVDTGLTIYDWLIVSNGTNNGYHVDFTDPAFVGYDPASPDQTINIQFTYQVNDGATPTQPDCPGPFYCCEIDFLEGFPYECDAPRVCSCDLEFSYPDASSVSFTFYGLQRDTQQYFPIPPLTNSTVDTVSANPNELILSTAGWGVNAYQDTIVYIDGGMGAGQCRQVVSNDATTLTVSPDWDTPPDLTSTFYIANQYIPLPYVSGPTSLVNDYQINIYDAAGFNPNDTSTWTNLAYQITYNIGLAAATSVTITTQSGTLVPNKSYVAVLTANYNCGPSDPTFVNILTPLGVIVQLEQNLSVSPIFSAATGLVDNILDGGVTPPTSSYPVSLSANTSFPITVPALLGDSQFELTINPGTLIVANAICKCGLGGDPNETDSSQPDYRGNILGDFRGYEVRIEQFDPNTFVSGPIYDQSAPTPLPYITNSLDDPSLDFTAQPNTPLPPLLQVPVAYNQPYFWIKGVYDASKYPVNTSNDYHTVTLLGASKVTYNVATATTIKPGKFYIEIKKWNPGINAYVAYSPARVLAIDAYMLANVPVLPGTYTYDAVTLYPALASRQLSCKVGDALYIYHGTPFFPGILGVAPTTTAAGVSFTQSLTVTASASALQQYSCAGVTVNSTASLNSWIITEDFDITWDYIVTSP